MEENFGESRNKERDDRDSKIMLRAPPSLHKGERGLLSAPKWGLWLVLLDPCGYQARHTAVVIMEVSSRPGYRKSFWLCNSAI